MAIKLKGSNANLDLKTNIGQLIKGEDGGYYIPAVDEAGNLTWIASNEEMPSIEGTNITGPQGEAFTYEDFTPEQLEALRGPQGIQGVQGIQGIQGNPGKDGINGTNGIDGVDGKDGESGVYVGTEEPTDDSVIWINPEGSSSSVATTEYVDNAIANALSSIANAEDGAY